MPTARRSRTIDADVETVWAVIADPYHLPRWWPRVRHVEGAEPGRWTKVMATQKGKLVRADERLVEHADGRGRRWTQELEDSPFERLFSEVSTEVRLEPEGDRTAVVLELRQRLRGVNRLGGFLVRRAAGRLLDEALDGLERACGR